MEFGLFMSRQEYRMIRRRMTAGMNAATPLTVSGDWNGIRLRAFGKGR